ncbi:MAG: response regulator, partial [Candidatus Cloacimonadota bacterium]|nr:response regulator [Candidatus Cloacimonadota bacterium]
MNNKILIIDDERVIQDSLRIALRNENYDFHFAENGKEGLRKFKEISPILIILDIRMPIMNGIEFLEKLQPSISDSYAIIVLTGHGTNTDVKSAYNLGIKHFLRKPFNVVELLGLVKSLIKSKRHEIQLQYVNDLLQKKHNQLIHSKRLALLGEVSSSIIHQIKQPLMLQKMSLDELQYNLRNNQIDFEEMNESIEESKNNLSIIQAYVSKILSISYFDEEDFDENIDIEKLLNETQIFLKKYLKENDVVVEYRICENYPLITGSSNQLQQVFLNLITNAVDALSKKDNKIIKISVAQQENYLLIDVSDNGSGISEKNLDKIFETFFTSKDKGKGTGLGLSICKSIIKSHNGTIDVYSNLDK